MRKDIKEKWVEALRSGKYTQGRGMLYDGQSYCCLGVLARVAGIVNMASVSDLDLLTDDFLEGIEADDIIQTQLAEMNDGERDSITGEIVEEPMTFPQIADFIERNY